MKADGRGKNQMTVNNSTAFSKSKADAISENIIVKKIFFKKQVELNWKTCDVVPFTGLIFI